MIVSAILGSLGYLIMLLIMYIPILTGGVAPFINTIYQTLFVIIAVQLFPLFLIVSLISTYFYEKTGLVYAGAFVNAFFITWYMVAAQATHIAVC
jgi:TM2 domain-containing membrane protein YozV